MNLSRRSFHDRCKLTSGACAPKAKTFNKVAIPQINIGSNKTTAYHRNGTRHKINLFNKDLVPDHPAKIPVTINADTRGPSGFNPPLVGTPANFKSQGYQESKYASKKNRTRGLFFMLLRLITDLNYFGFLLLNFQCGVERFSSPFDIESNCDRIRRFRKFRMRITQFAIRNLQFEIFI
jgi:hypothetical protein